MYLQLLYILDGLSPLVVRTPSLCLSDAVQPEVTLSAVQEDFIFCSLAGFLSDL